MHQNTRSVFKKERQWRKTHFGLLESYTIGYQLKVSKTTQKRVRMIGLGDSTLVFCTLLLLVTSLKIISSIFS